MPRTKGAKNKPSRGKGRAPAPTTLNNWWKKAVRAKRGDMCMWPDRCGQDGTDVHHYVHKTYGMLKYDVENGVILCRAHHDEADRATNKEAIGELLNMSYLVDIQQKYRSVKDYLAEKGITRAEFLQDELQRLKDVVQYGR